MKNHYEIAREALAFYGAENTALQDFLAILIGPEADSSITGKLAGLGVKNLSQFGIEDFKCFKGIDDEAAKRIVSAFGIADQFRRSKKEDKYIIRRPKDAAEYFSDLENKQQEYFEAIYLNTKSVVLERRNIFKGTLNASLVHPRETFREAVKISAASIVVAHNHPSGDTMPSNEDIKVTKRLDEVGKFIGIGVLDHIIIGDNGEFLSMYEKGYIQRK